MRRSDLNKVFFTLFLASILVLVLSCQITDRQSSAAVRTGAVARVARLCLPSVVLVTVSPLDGGSYGGCRGSGLVLTWDGEILTNHHLVRPRSRYQITTWSGRTYVADLVRSDPNSDLALLQVVNLREILTPVRFCRYDPIIGETVVVIGNALARGHIVTSGIISAVDQTVRLGRIEFTGLLQSDAPINPGNSGGALLTITGRLLGVVNSKARGADGVGWAIPMTAVRRFLK